jgi:hypothetical protein
MDSEPKRVPHKNEWGPIWWNWLHVGAIGYPASPSPAEAIGAFRRIQSFINHIPCSGCRGHAARFFRRNPPDLESTHSLQAWAWTFHNEVNARLKKPCFSYADYQLAYADELDRADWADWAGAAPVRTRACLA